MAPKGLDGDNTSIWCVVDVLVIPVCLLKVFLDGFARSPGICNRRVVCVTFSLSTEVLSITSRLSSCAEADTYITPPSPPPPPLFFRVTHSAFAPYGDIFSQILVFFSVSRLGSQDLYDPAAHIQTIKSLPAAGTVCIRYYRLTAADADIFLTGSLDGAVDISR